MAIRVECANCQAAFSARDELAGRKGKCPRCQAAIVIPAVEANLVTPVRRSAPTPAAKATKAGAVDSRSIKSAQESPPGEQSLTKRRAALQQQLAAGFERDITKVRVSVLYRVGLLLTVMIMMLLPIAYV